ncbi:MAG: DUF503 domain-containing protein [bacterium]
MFVGTIQIELFLSEADSLKGKRFILQSLKKKLRNKFNISIAEIDYHNKWQRSHLGIACVSSDRRFIDQVFSKVLNFIDNENRVEVLDSFVEVL